METTLHDRESGPGQPAYHTMESVHLASAPAGSAHLVSTMLDIIEEVAPLPASRRKNLRFDVLDLWRDLTSEKSERHADYMGDPSRLAAYLRYFMPWNVVKLVPLLAGLDMHLAEGDSVLDIGSGPLTLPVALWIARPELRAVPLRFTCLDRVRRTLEAGQAILEGLAMRTGQPLAWTVTLSKDTFATRKTDDAAGTYALVTAANVFNESFWHARGSLSERAEQLAVTLRGLTAADGRILVVEPGDPRTGAMMAALRESVLLGGGSALAPCTHQAACPMAGAFLSAAFRHEKPQSDRPMTRAEALKAARAARAAFKPPIPPVVTAHNRSKAPWCHFVIDLSAAPERLVSFSETAGLPKDRLVASWLYMSPGPAVGTGAAGSPSAGSTPGKPGTGVRIVSDPFRLASGGSGRYACTGAGYTLVTGELARLPSCALAALDRPIIAGDLPRDEKSGAVLVITAPGTASAQIPASQEPIQPHARRSSGADTRGKRNDRSRGNGPVDASRPAGNTGPDRTARKTGESSPRGRRPPGKPGKPGKTDSPKGGRKSHPWRGLGSKR